MKHFIIYKAICIVFLLSLCGCTPRQAQYGSYGALAGAAIGSTMGGHHSNAFAVTQGALMGGIIGGAIGAASEYPSNYSYSNKQLIVICPTCDSHVDVSDFPLHSTVECPKCLTHFTY